MLGPALCLAPLSAAQELETGGVCCGLMDAYSLYDAFPCEWDFRLAYAIQIATLEEPILVTALYRGETGAVFAKTQALIASQVDVLTAYLLANIEAFWGKDSFASTFYVPIKPAKRRLPWHTPQLARATCGHTGHFGAGALRAFLLPRRGRLPARKCGLRA